MRHDMVSVIDKAKYLVRTGFAHVMVGNTLIMAIGFLSSICIVRLISKESYGLLCHADNMYQYVLLFSGLGMSTALLKFCSTGTDPQKAKSLLVFSLKYGVLIQLFLTALMVFYATVVSRTFPKANYLIYSSILYPASFYVVTTLQSYLRSQQENKLYARIALAQSTLVFVLSVLLALVLDAAGVVLARYLGLAAAVGLGLRYVVRRLGSVTLCKVSLTTRKAFVGMSVAMMLTNMFSSVIATNEMFLVNHLIHDAAITATYRVAVLIPGQLLVIAGSVVVYVFPLVAGLSCDKSRALSIVLRTGAATFVAVAICAAVGRVVSPLLIRIVYGVQYENAIPLSNAFWFVHGLNAGVRMIPLNLLPAIGEAKFCAYMSVITCAVHFVLDYVFIKSIGIEGVAYAAGLVYFCSGGCYWLYTIYSCKKGTARGCG